MTKNKPAPGPSPADIIKAEALAKTIHDLGVLLKDPILDQVHLAMTHGGGAEVPGMYARGKEHLRALTKVYNRLSLFLDPPTADPRFATTVSMPVPKAVRDAKPPAPAPAPEPAPEPVDDAFRDDERDMALERRLEAERDADHDRP